MWLPECRTCLLWTQAVAHDKPPSFENCCVLAQLTWRSLPCSRAFRRASSTCRWAAPGSRRTGRTRRATPGPARSAGSGRGSADRTPRTPSPSFPPPSWTLLRGSWPRKSWRGCLGFTARRSDLWFEVLSRCCSNRSFCDLKGNCSDKMRPVGMSGSKSCCSKINERGSVALESRKSARVAAAAAVGARASRVLRAGRRRKRRQLRAAPSSGTRQRLSQSPTAASQLSSFFSSQSRELFRALLPLVILRLHEKIQTWKVTRQTS